VLLHCYQKLSDSNESESVRPDNLVIVEFLPRTDQLLLLSLMMNLVVNGVAIGIDLSAAAHCSQ
jgi:hypothetical protein